MKLKPLKNPLKPKRSALFNLYNDRIARCKTSDELLKLSREVSMLQLNVTEKTALCLLCVYAAKWFDKHGCAPSKEQLEGGNIDV